MNDIRQQLRARLLNVDAASFEALALDVFRYQAQCNSLYQSYVNHIGVNVDGLSTMEKIPCLPIQFFKTEIIKSGQWEEEVIFESSGTTGQVTNKQYVRELDLYNRLTVKSFESVYGNPNGYCFLGLLPHYLERSGSSLVQMVRHFIDLSDYNQSGFFLNDMDRLVEVLASNIEQSIPTVLIGVSFALIDLAEAYDLNLSGVIVMETGGMKGRREEWSKAKLHQFLADRFQVEHIHSEYGMTELSSQFYARQNGRFAPSCTARTVIKEMADPFAVAPAGKSGVINVIDLGNLDTCAFIETQDLGIAGTDGYFEIIGRLDHSDIRGCNLMVQ